MNFGRFGHLAIYCCIAAALCAIALGMMPIGVHEGWWSRSVVLPAVLPTCLFGYVLLLLSVGAAVLERMRAPRA